jgi:inosose dehydratase
MLEQGTGQGEDHGYQGTLSMECEGQAGPMIEKPLAWLRQTLAELKIAVEQ